MKRSGMSFIYSCSHVFFKLYLKVRHGYTVEGLENVPKEGGALIASNHVSFLDPPSVCASIPFRQTYFMARDTLYKNKFSAWWLKNSGVIALDRTRGDLAALKGAVKFLSSGKLVCLFPEGTRSLDGTLQEPKGGIGFLIAKSGVPVVPAYIKGSYEAWPPGDKRANPHKITLTFGKPIDPSEFSALGKGRVGYEASAALVMNKIADLRDANTTKLISED